MKVTLSNNGGWCRLRWYCPVFEERRSFNPGIRADEPGQLLAEQVANQMRLDILSGSYDPTLEKYRTRKQNGERRYQALIKALKKRLRDRHNAADESLMRVLEAWGKSIKNPSNAKQFFDWLRDERGLVVSSRKRYRDTLRRLAPELFADIELEKAPTRVIKPFSQSEVLRIFKWFKGKHYEQYVRWQFQVGTRPSEAFGLRWRDIDFSTGKVTIEETLKRRRGNSSKRIRSTTKTGKSRVIPVPASLLVKLSVRKGECDELVFIGPSGNAIDDRNFRRRAWVPCLKDLNIDYRRPYYMRHTCASHLIANGVPLTQVSSYVGNTVETLARYYAGALESQQMPVLYQEAK